jgi:hypothetical protein
MSQRLPSGLGKAGRALWKSITDDNDLRPDELRMLEDAAREVDLIATMDAAREAPDFELIVRGSMGQDVINPLVAELRQHRSTVASLLKSLKLSDENTAESRSASARAAANARWARRSS